MSSVARPAGPVHVGMDTSKNTIMAAMLWPGEESPVTERIINDEPSVRRLFGRLTDKTGGRECLRCCYEAGPLLEGPAAAARPVHSPGQPRQDPASTR